MFSSEVFNTSQLHVRKYMPISCHIMNFILFLHRSSFHFPWTQSNLSNEYISLLELDMAFIAQFKLITISHLLTYSILLGNRFISHKLQFQCSIKLVRMYIHEYLNYFQNFSSNGLYFIAQINHLPKLLYLKTTVTKTDKTLLEFDVLLNKSSSQLSR
jgi:hypothetical protein